MDQQMLPLDMTNLSVLTAELREHLETARRMQRSHSLAVLPCTWEQVASLLDDRDRMLATAI